MRGRKIFPVLALVIFLAVPAYTTAQIIDDDYPYNLVNPWAHFDYQDYDTWSEGYPGGSEGRSGAYFNIGVAVLPDPTRDHLKDYGEVIRIRARHVDSGRVFDLEPSECTDLLGTGLQNWSLQLRPKTWMFEGTWRFIMTTTIARIP